MKRLAFMGASVAVIVAICIIVSSKPLSNVLTGGEIVNERYIGEALLSDASGTMNTSAPTDSPSAAVQKPAPTDQPAATQLKSETPAPTVATTPIPAPTETQPPTTEIKATETPIPTAEPTIAAIQTSPAATIIAAPTLMPDSSLPNKKLSWYFNRNSSHQPPTAQRDFDISKYDSYYLGDINSKVVYLTFDEGYEAGYTGKILDILKEKNVQAAFFLTKSYIRDNVDLTVRIAEEGHVAANHSATHPSFPDISDEQVAYELDEAERYYQEITGYSLAKFFRPPAGEYSVRTLDLTQKLGYKTIFWSYAYQDWLVDKQPGKEYAYDMFMNNLHNGGIYLLHAVSSSNTEALADIIDAVREQGYEFKSLYELP